MSYRRIKLGEILTESKIPSRMPNPNKRIKVKLNVMGVEKRQFENEISGATKQYVRKAGQFIYGKQNFHKGAFGIIPKELDGYESSSDLPAFDVSSECLAEWIYYFFKNNGNYLNLSSLARGVATKRIHPEQIYDLEIPLPDIKIQESVLDIIHEIEKNNVDIQLEFSFQLKMLNQLRQAFLKEAMQGNLIKQDPNDEPASELLKRIKSEKEKLIKEKKLKKEKELPPIKKEVIPFEIPKNWVWVRLRDLCEEIVDCPHSTPKYIENDTGYYAIDTNCINEDGEITKLRNLAESSYIERIKRLTPKENDIVYSREGTIGLAAFIPEDKKICLGQRVMLFRSSKLISFKYLKYCVTNPEYIKNLLSMHRGMGAKHINVRDIINSLIPLCPYNEQIKIVKKLNQLMKLCDELEESIKKSKQETVQLLQVSLKEALEGKTPC